MRLVLLNSGGKDSLAAAMLATRDGHELASLYVDMGQPTRDIEEEAARRTAARFCALGHEVVTVNGGPYSTPRNRMNGIAFQPVVLHALAASYACVHGYDGIVSGQQAAPLRDGWREQFTGALRSAYFTPGIEVVLPVFDWTDDRMFEFLRDDATWQDAPTCACVPACGNCYKCNLRRSWIEARR